MHHATYARQDDVNALLEMLEGNPRLLLETGNVITSGGDELRRVTIYEYLLGAGDYELTEMVRGYFSEINDEQGNPIEDAEKQRIRQYERYKPHIEGDFPLCASNDSLDGLGEDFTIGIMGGRSHPTSDGVMAAGFGKLMSNKNLKLAGLKQPHPACQPTRCVIL